MVVSEVEVDVFLEFSCFFNIQWMLAIYVELGRIAFQVYCILLLFCLFILLIFKFDVEAPTTNLNLST